MTSIYYAFLYTAFLSLILPIFIPSWPHLYFVPFLVHCFYRSTLLTSLRWSLICGLIVDLFSAETRLGMFAFNYCATTLLLYRYKLHFFEDRMSTLSVMTFNYSCLFTLFHLIIFFLIQKPVSLSWNWLFNNFFLVPFQVSIYALFAFTIPSLLFFAMKKRYSLFRLRSRRL